jgi:hypothetical protein
MNASPRSTERLMFGGIILREQKILQSSAHNLPCLRITGLLLDLFLQCRNFFLDSVPRWFDAA